MSDRNAVTNAVTNGVTNGAQTSPSVVISNEITTEQKSPSSEISSISRSDILNVVTGGEPGIMPRLAVTPGIPADIDAAAAAEVAAEQIQSRLDAFFARRPADFAEPGNLDPRLVEWARAFLAGNAGNLVITGNVGTGKTWSTWRIGEELLNHGYRGRIEITTAYRIKRLVTPPPDFAEMDRLAAANLLALDDIGAVRVSEWDADHLYGLIDERSSARRPLIIVANATAPPEEGKTVLESLLGERVASRIAKNVTIVKLTGPDRRRMS